VIRIGCRKKTNFFTISNILWVITSVIGKSSVILAATVSSQIFPGLPQAYLKAAEGCS
jgi:hypothetical protein